MFRRFLLLIPALLLVAGLAFTACDDDDEEDDGGGAATVDVELNEFTVSAAPDSVDAGEVEFVVENIGDETHEFVIAQTDLDADALPTGDDGSVDEEGGGVEVVDEIEDIASGSTQNLTADLEAGSYVLFCNIVDDEGDVHYAEGMYTGFTVE
jgi:uncharacterized cupredoxin-like copper-binding protein